MIDCRDVGSITFKDKLEAEKAKSTLQLLFKAARILNERAIERARVRSGKPIRVAHTLVLPHIEVEGTRLTDLAARLGVTKQATGQLVDEMEAMGVLERVPDPDDARAKLVRFSRRGQSGLMEGLSVLSALEQDLRDAVGDTKIDNLHDALATILAALDETGLAAAKPAKKKRR